MVFGLVTGTGNNDAYHAVVQWYIRDFELRKDLKNVFKSSRESAVLIGPTEDIELESVIDLCKVCAPHIDGVEQDLD